MFENYEEHKRFKFCEENKNEEFEIFNKIKKELLEIKTGNEENQNIYKLFNSLKFPTKNKYVNAQKKLLTNVLKFTEERIDFTDKVPKIVEIVENLISCSREYFDLDCLIRNESEMIFYFYPFEVMKNFSKSLLNYIHVQCRICKRRWPIEAENKSKINPNMYMCDECKKYEKLKENKYNDIQENTIDLNPFTKYNKMIPCKVPFELSYLSFFEKLLIARVNPVMSVITISNKNVKIQKFRGHIINISQDIGNIAKILPRLPKEMNTVLIKKNTIRSETVKLFKICKKKL